MEQMMNFEQEESVNPESVQQEIGGDNIDEYMLNFGTGLNMDMQFIQSGADLGIGSDGLNLFE